MRIISLAFVFYLSIIRLNHVEASHIVFSNNGPVVLGAEITINAEIKDGGQYEYSFHWEDDAIKRHKYTVEGNFPSTQWKISYPAEDYAPSNYTIQLTVYRKYFFPFSYESARTQIEVTALLNGEMTIKQNNATRNNFVANHPEVEHIIALKDTDRDFIIQNNTQIQAFWFVDCIYYGYTSDLSFKFNYTKIDSEHVVETLIVASQNVEPLTTTTPQPPPSTTPTTPSTTTTTTTTTPASITTTVPSSNSTKPSTTVVPLTSTTTITPTTEMIIKANITNLKTQLNTTNILSLTKILQELPFNTSFHQDSVMPNVCLNSSLIEIAPNKTYGYFYKKFTVKEPIKNLKIEGTNWLQHGDLLNLTISCEGSGKFASCFYFVLGIVNATGNESCQVMFMMDKCHFTIERYLGTPHNYTLIFIIQNQVTKNVKAEIINIYQVNKRAQLSVIVVPVSCSLIAVILIVFGVAYYMQNRNRYIVEVANFDFGQSNEMEYKTFKERLKDSFSEAFARTQDYHKNWKGSNSTRNGTPEPEGYTNLE